MSQDAKLANLVTWHLQPETFSLLDTSLYSRLILPQVFRTQATRRGKVGVRTIGLKRQAVTLLYLRLPLS
jgi:hypothetical protein